jgi:hypothetical protein
MFVGKSNQPWNMEWRFKWHAGMILDNMLENGDILRYATPRQGAMATKINAPMNTEKASNKCFGWIICPFFIDCSSFGPYFLRPMENLPIDQRIAGILDLRIGPSLSKADFN